MLLRENPLGFDKATSNVLLDPFCSAPQVHSTSQVRCGMKICWGLIKTSDIMMAPFSLRHRLILQAKYDVV